MLWALLQCVASELSVLVVLHLSEVSAIIADCSLCGSVLGRWADEAAPVGLTLLVVDRAVLVQGAVPALVISRIVVIMLLVIEVEAVSLAVWVLIGVVIQEPHCGLILCLVALVLIGAVRAALVLRADERITVVHIPITDL